LNVEHSTNFQLMRHSIDT